MKDKQETSDSMQHPILNSNEQTIREVLKNICIQDKLEQK